MYLRNLGWYVAGFLLTRVVEFPLKVALGYIFVGLFELVGVYRFPDFQMVWSNIPESTWWHHRHDIRDITLWGMWFIASLLAWTGYTLSELSRSVPPRAVRGFFAIFLILGLFGYYAGRFGWRYYTPFLVTEVPLGIAVQFYSGVLFARVLPHLYKILAETRVEDWLARRRSKA